MIAFLGSLAGIVAAWYFRKQITQLWQAYRSARQKSEVGKVITDTEELNRQINRESDHLKDIEGR